MQIPGVDSSQLCLRRHAVPELTIAQHLERFLICSIPNEISLLERLAPAHQVLDVAEQERPVLIGEIPAPYLLPLLGPLPLRQGEAQLAR